MLFAPRRNHHRPDPPPDDSTDENHRVRMMATAPSSMLVRPPRLKGRYVAVLGGAAAGEGARALTNAALVLGASVVRLDPEVLDGGAAGAAATKPRSADVLGRLYDLIICDGMAGTGAASLAASCRAPVIDADAALALARAESAAPQGAAGATDEACDTALRAMLVRLLG